MRASHEVQTVVRLLDLMYEDAKDALVTVPAEGFSAAQATAQTLGRLHSQLTRPSFADSQIPYKRPMTPTE